MRRVVAVIATGAALVVPCTGLAATRHADVSVTSVVASPSPAPGGSRVTFAVTVSNAGPSATYVRVTNAAPDGWTNLTPGAGDGIQDCIPINDKPFGVLACTVLLNVGEPRTVSFDAIGSVVDCGVFEDEGGVFVFSPDTDDPNVDNDHAKGAATMTKAIAGCEGPDGSTSQPPRQPGTGTGTENPGSGDALTLSSLSLSRSTFRAARTGASIARKTPSTGTNLTVSLAPGNGTVRLTVQRLAAGRSVGNRCVARTRVNRARHACARTVKMPGHFDVAVAGTRRTVRFSGRIGGRSLAPGSYQLSGAVLTDGTTAAAGRRVAFRITA